MDGDRLHGADASESFLALAVRELSEMRGLPPLEVVESIENVPRLPSAREFGRRRNKSNDDGRSRAFGYLKLQFDRPVQGPLCLGYSSHFGLGLFLPAE